MYLWLAVDITATVWIDSLRSEGNLLNQATYASNK